MPQTAALTWDDVLKREDIIGGDIETIDNGVVYRGPLANIEVQENTIRFTPSWCGRLNGATWENCGSVQLVIGREAAPQDIGEGRIHFQPPIVGACTIFPKGDSKLDPYKVKGLPPAWKRLLTLYPSLPFDRDKAHLVLGERRFSSQVEAFPKLPADATLINVLDMFITDGSREEFLIFYIQAITGEEHVMEKVY